MFALGEIYVGGCLERTQPKTCKLRAVPRPPSTSHVAFPAYRSSETMTAVAGMSCLSTSMSGDSACSNFCGPRPSAGSRPERGRKLEAE
jgi:hypothetical protein